MDGVAGTLPPKPHGPSETPEEMNRGLWVFELWLSMAKRDQGAMQSERWPEERGRKNLRLYVPQANLDRRPVPAGPPMPFGTSLGSSDLPMALR